MSALRILVIDHNAAFTASAVDFLNLRPGLKVVATAGDGEWGLLEAHVLHVDIVLVDLELYGLSGLETIRRLRALLPDAGIIAVALNNQNSHQQAALLAGADSFVAKARFTQDVPAAIHRVTASYGLVPT